MKGCGDATCQYKYVGIQDTVEWIIFEEIKFWELSKNSECFVDRMSIAKWLSNITRIKISRINNQLEVL